ncbi:hypothetical protein Tco_1200750 [Tanacetum coccineum]
MISLKLCTLRMHNIRLRGLDDVPSALLTSLTVTLVIMPSTSPPSPLIPLITFYGLVRSPVINVQYMWIPDAVQVVIVLKEPEMYGWCIKIKKKAIPCNREDIGAYVIA